MLRTASEYLNDTLDNLSNAQFAKAVNAISSAHTVYVYGPGPSESLAELMCFRLNRMGKDINKIAKSGRELFERLINIKKEDVVLVFGFTRMIPEIRVILDFARDRGCTTMLITDHAGIRDDRHERYSAVYRSRRTMAVSLNGWLRWHWWNAL